MTSMTLAAGLVAAVSSATQAAGRNSSPQPAAASRVAGMGGAAQARLIAAEARQRRPGISIPLGAYTGTTELNTHARTGVLTGVVRSITGGPFAGACVSAAGPGGSASTETKADGRYQLSGLQPGRYVLRVAPCATARTPAIGPAAVSLWPGLPGTVELRAGQIATLPPATIAQHNRPRPGPSPASARARSKVGSISGLVTGHGRPLRGICVEAYPVNGGLIGQVTTSKNGRYRINHLPPGPYQVGFADQLCQTSAVNWLEQWYPGINTPFGPEGTHLRVRVGKDVSGIDGKLKLGGELTGIVRSQSGKGLNGICIYPTVVFGADGLNGTIYTELNTVKGGFFSWHGLFPGQYTMLFSIGCGSSGNYAFQWWKGATSHSRATTIRLTGHEIVRNVDPVLGPGAAITGTVRGRSAAGPALSGVCVYAVFTDDYDYADAVTGSDGRYELDGLASGRYQVVFDPTCGNGGPPPINYVGRTQLVTVKAGKTVRGFNAYLERGAILSGTVTDTSGRRLYNVCVQVGDPFGDFATTDQQGNYTMIGIQPGSYTVAFFGGCGNSGSLAPQSYNNQPDPFEAPLVSFKSGKTTANINAVMRPGGTIAGVVTNASGHRLNNICVDAQTQAQFATGEYAGNANTSHGRYALRNLAPGLYLISFNCDGGNRYTSPWFNGQADSTTAELLSVHPGVITAANSNLGLAGSIAGTVSDKSGRPLGGICASLDNAGSQTSVSTPSSPAFTGPGGRYRIDGLTPGRYLVQFSPCIGRIRYAARWYRNKATTASATPVTVKAGRTTSRINAVMAFGGSISGRVTGPTGEPLHGICVEVLDAPGQIAGFTQTNRAGRYAFTGLASGRYALYFFRLATGSYTLFAPCQPVGPSPTGAGRRGLVTVAAPKAATGINFELEPGGSVSGRVTSAAPPLPLSGLCVLLRPVNRRNGSDIAFTGSNGRYAVSDLAPGKYQAYVNDPSCLTSAGPAPQWYKGQRAEATATDFTVMAGHTTTGIDAALEPFGGITGTVTNRAHGGVRGECVTAVPVAPAVDPFDGVPQAAEVAVTTGGGRYTLADMPAGRYKVEFSVGCGAKGYTTQWWHNAASRRSAKVITVGFSTVGGIDAALRR